MASFTSPCTLYPKGIEKIRNSKFEIRNSNLDWRIYADATCAGLSVLIPLPLIDIVFEIVFRRRIPGTIARARHREVTRSLGDVLSSHWKTAEASLVGVGELYDRLYTAELEARAQHYSR